MMAGRKGMSGRITEMKRLIGVAVLACSIMVSEGFQVVFSKDGKTVGSSARECPTQGVDIGSGKVVVGLHAVTDLRRAACGWYRLIPTEVPTATNGVRYVVGGYEFLEDGTCKAVYRGVTVKPKSVRYSKLAIIRKLKAIPSEDGSGTKWDELKAKLTEMGLLDEFISCSWIAGDDETFVAAKPKLAAFLGMEESDLESMLSECLY